MRETVPFNPYPQARIEFIGAKPLGTRSGPQGATIADYVLDGGLGNFIVTTAANGESIVDYPDTLELIRRATPAGTWTISFKKR